jgi:hypothetical protein
VLLRWSHLAIDGGMLFQHERSQFLGQGAGHVFTLRERHQLVLVGLTKHSFKRRPGPLEPTFPKCLAILAAQK